MASIYTRATSVVCLAMLLAACASDPAPPPDTRYEEQKRGADKAQQELSREMQKTY